MDASSRTSAKLQRRLAWFAFAFGTATFFVGLAGYVLTPGVQASAWPRILFNLAGLLLLDGLEGPEPEHWLFDAARVLAVCTAASGVAFVVLSLYKEGIDQVKLGVLGWHSRKRRGSHTVVCGLGRVGHQLVRDLRDRSKPVVVIESDPANPHIEEARRLGATVLEGDATEPALRRQARLYGAERVFVVAGGDARNLGIAEDIRADLEGNGPPHPRGGRPLRCHTNVLGLALTRTAERTLGASDAATFRVFNTDEDAARQLLLNSEWGLARVLPDRPELRTVPLHPDEVAHYVVMGFGPMGQAVALQMARLAHFRNRKRLRLTIVDRFDDPAGRQAKQAFLDRHPGFAPADLNLPTDLGLVASAERTAEGAPDQRPDLDAWNARPRRPAHPDWRIDAEVAVEYAVNAEFLSMPTSVDAPDLVDRLLRRLQPAVGPRPLGAAVVCFEDDQANFEVALRLQAALRVRYWDGALERPLPIYAYVPDEQGLWDLLARERTAIPIPVYPFGRREDVAGYDRIVRAELREMAAATHDYYEAAYGADPPRPFEVLDPVFKASNEDSAAHADVKLDAVGLTRRPLTLAERRAQGAPPPVPPLSDAQVETLAQVEHNRWMGERLAAGWRYGARSSKGENERRLTFCAWEDLTDADERAKDVRHVEALATMFYQIGYVIEAPDVPKESATETPSGTFVKETHPVGKTRSAQAGPR